MSALELNVGLIGFGTVGGAFAVALAERAEAVEARFGVRLALAQVAVARPGEPRRGAWPARVHADAAGLAADPGLDVVVEATASAAAAAWLRVAHRRGAVVVTANKQALAADPGLLELLARGDPRLLCEAAVGAAVPVVRALQDSLAADEIRSVRGVLNGTTTFVLSRIERGAELAAAVREAQEAGYAEPDPANDLSGRDAAAKLALLLTLAWREPVGLERVRFTGLEPGIEEEVRRAAASGGRLRLVAEAARGGDPEAAVGPRLLDLRDPLAAATGVENVIEVEAAVAGPLAWRGTGAGGRATASALLADTLAAARYVAATRAVGRAVVPHEPSAPASPLSAPASPLSAQPSARVGGQLR